MLIVVTAMNVIRRPIALWKTTVQGLGDGAWEVGWIVASTAAAGGEGEGGRPGRMRL